MQREIKFRGKRIDGNGWIVGFFYQHQDGRTFILRELNPDKKVGVCSMFSEVLAMEVDPNSVGEYIGQKDKNDKEIYAGDIIRILYTDWASQHLGTEEQRKMTLEEYKKSISKIGVVKFYIDRYAEYGLDFHGYSDSIYEGKFGEKEIIGNIYENPELLTL